jgi:hypothetical protein
MPITAMSLITDLLAPLRRAITSPRLWWRGNGAGLRTRPDDRFIVSYPKSGNTWMRVMIASLLEKNRDFDMGNLSRLVPDVYKSTAAEMAALPSPRFIKSHEPLRTDYGRVLYIVRDPRDVLVSYFHYRKRGRDDGQVEDMAAFTERFLAGRTSFGCWDVHVGGWLQRAAIDRNVTVIRYEDLVADPKKWLRQASTALRLEVDDAAIDAAVAAGSFDRLRDQEKEARERGAFPGLENSRTPFFRRGKAGGYRDELPPELIEKVVQRLGPVMRQAGYDPVA